MQGERLGRTPFARIYEWLDIAEKFTFEDPQVGLAGGLAATTCMSQLHCCDVHSAWLACPWFVLLVAGLHALLLLMSVLPLLPLLLLLPLPSCCLLQKQEAFATFDFAALRAEVASVQAAAAAARSPIVFAHNDLLSGGCWDWPWVA